MTTQSGRIHGLDVLRGVAMTLGVFLHGAIAYKKGYHFGSWVFDDSFTSWIFDWLYFWINSFRMQVFFLLAGFFARLMIVRGGAHSFGINRARRVGMPLLISYFTILPLTLVPYLYMTFEGGGHPWEQLSDFFVRFFTLRTAYGFMHLWFLQHLLVYYAITIFLVLTGSWLKIEFKNTHLFANLKLTSVQFLLITLIPLTCITLWFSTPLPSIWTGFIIPPVQLTYYGFFFVLGWILENNRNVFISFGKNAKLFLATGTALSIFILYYLNVVVFDQTTETFLAPFSVQVVLMKFIFSIVTIMLVIGSIGLFSTLFQNPSRFWKYIADSAYWIYLIHLPIVMGTQLLLLHSNVPGILRFPIVILITLLLAFTSYHYLVRFTWIGTMLNGPRTKEKIAATS